jgi:thiosulfate/3-mercaptopyruvate sulfurtransferase
MVIPNVVDPASLHVMMDAHAPIVVDVRSEKDWRSASIPGAVFVNVYDYFIPESDEGGIDQMACAVSSAFAAVGIDGTRPVVFYEEATGMISPRALWFHELLGMSGGAILDGGISAWRNAGFAVAPGAGANAVVDATHPQGARPAGVQRALVADLDEVRAAGGAAAVILDVRRPTEHAGAFVHPCCARAGRIPGSVLLFWEDVLDNGRYRAPDDLAARFRQAGLRPDQEIITYCHRGARAATVFYALKRAGFSRPRVFVGSWHEWAARAELPADLG